MLVMLIESLGNFLHSNLALNLLSSKLNQKFRHAKPIYILQAYCYTPIVGSFSNSLIRMILIFLK